MPTSKSFHATPNSLAVFASPTSSPARPSVPLTRRSRGRRVARCPAARRERDLQIRARAALAQPARARGVDAREQRREREIARSAACRRRRAARRRARRRRRASRRLPSARASRASGCPRRSPRRGPRAAMASGSGCAAPSRSMPASATRTFATRQVQGFEASAAASGAGSADAARAAAARRRPGRGVSSGTGTFAFGSITTRAPSSATSDTAACCFTRSSFSRSTAEFLPRQRRTARGSGRSRRRSRAKSRRRSRARRPSRSDARSWHRAFRRDRSSRTS